MRTSRPDGVLSGTLPDVLTADANSLVIGEPRPTVLVKMVTAEPITGAQAGPTYVTWRWNDDFRPQAVEIPLQKVQRALGHLANAIPGRLGDHESAMADALRGPLADRDLEDRWARNLGRLLLPDALIAQVLQRSPDLPILRIHSSGRLAQVPWELLAIDADGRRLVDVADIRADVPVTVRAARDQRRPPAMEPSNGPVLYLLDPWTGGGRTLDPDLPAAEVLATHLSGLPRYGRVAADAVRPKDLIAQRISRADVSRLLRADPGPSRLLFVGHVVAPDLDDRPEEAALYLTDGRKSFGYARLQPRGPGGQFRVHRRPLTAFDLFAGTLLDADPEAEKSRADLGPERLPGERIWPMPPRVALLACDSGTDLRFPEMSGLVAAVVNNGAQIVTATRWSMPTDTAYEDTGRLDADRSPTFEMVAGVDAAHEAGDPFATLKAWYRTRLDAWRDHGNLADSPLTWAALTTYDAPAVGTS